MARKSAGEHAASAPRCLGGPGPSVLLSVATSGSAGLQSTNSLQDVVLRRGGEVFAERALMSVRHIASGDALGGGKKGVIALPLGHRGPRIAATHRNGEHSLGVHRGRTSEARHPGRHRDHISRPVDLHRIPRAGPRHPSQDQLITTPSSKMPRTAHGRRVHAPPHHQRSQQSFHRWPIPSVTSRAERARR
jgi:hypothetical protein